MGFDDNKLCENCKWFSAQSSMSTDGECRRYPPQLYPQFEGQKYKSVIERWTEPDSDFPRVKKLYFCGEWNEL